MDRLLNNPWIMKIIALLLALMLYLSVSIDNQDTNTILGTSKSSGTGTETITNVPVEVSYDQDNMIISGVPDTVNVTLEGSKSALQQEKLKQDLEVYVDLNNYGLGEHQVELQHRNISDRLDVKIDPQVVTVSIENQQSQEFPVEASFDKNQVKKGYKAGSAQISPETVTVTGAKSQLSQVAYVKALVELDNVSKDVNEQAEVVAFDKNLNKLDVAIEPEVVNVTIPIENRSKKVPISLEQTGTLGEGIEITDLSLDKDEVTVIGEKDVLDSISSIDNIPVDVTGISKTSEVKVDVPVPEGADSVQPKQVTVSVNVKKLDEEEEEETDAEETSVAEEEKDGKKSFESLSVSLNGQNSKYKYEILSPKNGAVRVDLSGPQQQLRNVTRSDIGISANVARLTPGEFSVPISLTVPSGIEGTLSTKTLRVKVSERNPSDEEEQNPSEPPEEGGNNNPDEPSDPSDNTGSNEEYEGNVENNASNEESGSSSAN
ncbi:CdaR family protein [Priestia flexa]|uniref:CdaR family protein n=1 Tax=Priestia flexa TaxID=86664 RepID=UPI0024BF20A4|nr:CdaR family protein [Priestia flexa]WHX79270.1 CdaR family protein [Priestia flexa]